MVSKYEEVLTKFDSATALLDKISEECQNYAHLLLVNSKQSADSSNCCEEMVADVKQVRMLIKKLNYKKQQIAAMNKIKTKDVVARRNTRTSSMKYLAQWEKMVEAQLADSGGPQCEEPLTLLPKPVIKRRIRQFENKDTKRISSTAEFFLDDGAENCGSCSETIHEGEEEEDFSEDSKVETLKESFSSDGGGNRFKPRVVDVVYKLQIPNEETV